MTRGKASRAKVVSRRTGGRLETSSSMLMYLNPGWKCVTRAKAESASSPFSGEGCHRVSWMGSRAHAHAGKASGDRT